MWETGFLQHLKNFVARNYNQDGIFDSKLSHGEDRDVSMSSVEAALGSSYNLGYVPFISVFYRYHHNSITGDRYTTEYVESQNKQNFKKHFGPKGVIATDMYLQRFLSDLPWSLLTFMPYDIKLKLRPIKYFFKRCNFTIKHPKTARKLEQRLLSATF